MTVNLGASPKTTQRITDSLKSILHNQGGHFAFNGTAPNLETGSFAFDLTDLLHKNPSYQRFYLQINEQAQSALRFFSLVDPLHQSTIPYRGSLPMTLAAHQVATPHIDYSVSDKQREAAINAKDLSVSITHPCENDRLSGAIHITVAAPLPAQRVAFYLDGNLVAVDDSAPFHLLLNTTKWANGVHLLRATAYDHGTRDASSEVYLTFEN